MHIRLIQFHKERLWLAQCLPSWQFTGNPVATGCTVIVTQYQMCAPCIGHCFCILATKDRLVVAEHVVNLFAAVRQDRRPEQFEPVDGLQRHIDCGGGARRIGAN